MGSEAGVGVSVGMGVAFLHRERKRANHCISRGRSFSSMLMSTVAATRGDWLCTSLEKKKLGVKVIVSAHVSRISHGSAYREALPPPKKT